MLDKLRIHHLAAADAGYWYRDHHVVGSDSCPRNGARKVHTNAETKFRLGFKLLYVRSKFGLSG